MNSEAHPHVFMVCFPGQGHINPMLRLGKKLAANGRLVTLSTTVEYGNQMKEAGSISDQPTPVGHGFIRFEFFDGGHTDPTHNFDFEEYVSKIEHCGRISLSQLISKQSEENRPVSFVIGNPYLPWICDVADQLGIASAILWVLSCASFSAFYHHFLGSVPFPSRTEPNVDVQLPSMPLLKYDEIPSFLLPTDMGRILGRNILAQFRNLSKAFCIFIDTFEELEPEIINYMSKIFPIKPVGPLLKSSTKIKTTISGDCLKVDDCIEWLNSKPPQSVIYVSFGSVVYLKQEQVDEIAYGLSNSGFPFLWVLKPHSGMKHHVLPDQVVEEAGERAKVVQWSPQEQVLSHPSVGCFMMHCGWNSSVEALSFGVPVVAFPQWGDQVINAKFMVDVFGVALRLSRGEVENRLVSRVEVQKCLREAMIGPAAVGIRQNAMKWQKATEIAVADDGSSDQNILEFTDEIKKRSVSANFHISPSTP